MMPYKNIGDNLTVREFNGIVSLIRDNILFHEDIMINTSNVTGAYGNYVFNFREATILDNGILITNETLSTIGTVKLTNPVFPNSNYYLDLKVYSSEDIGISGLDTDNVIVTPLTVKLEKYNEVNIPFETLDMNNIVGFDATIRIDHKDLVIPSEGTLNVSSNFTHMFPTLPITFTAQYFDEYNVPIVGETINFYEGESLIGSGVTDDDGLASISYAFSNLGTHTVYARAGGIFSDNTNVLIDNNGDMILNMGGDSISTFSSTPFVFNGDFLGINWGDNTFEQYTMGKLNHDYSSIEYYTINIIGEITSLQQKCFQECERLVSVVIPDGVTSLGDSCFFYCRFLESVVIPDSVTSLGDSCFAATRLTSVDIPNSVTRIADSCFEYNNYLISIQLNWKTTNEIISYNRTWIDRCDSFEYFLIPEGTKQLYLDKGYPSDKLRENIPFDDITLTSDKDILSYNGGTNPDTATLTAQLTYEGEPALVEGETVTFEVRKQSDDSLVETLSDVTDSSGVASVGYTSKHAGDLYIKSLCGLLTKTYEICDAIKYIDEVTKTHSSSSVEWYNLADLGTNIGDCEISATLKSTNANGFRLDFANSNQYENKHRIVLGTYNTGLKFISRYDVNGTENDYSTQVSYIANTDLSVKIIRQNGNLICSIDNINHTFSDLSNLRYIGLTMWSSAKTVTVTDLKVKPL